MKRVVIIGGSFGGLLAARSIINVVREDFELILISSSTHALFNIAAPRVLIEPENWHKLLFPVEKVLKSKKHATCKFIVGRVDNVSLDEKIVAYKDADKKDAKLTFDVLVIATGTRGETAAFQLNETIGDSEASHKLLVQQVRDANEIAVIGGGPTGVEVVGEIGDFYRKKKKIYLYHSKPYPLYSFGAEAGKRIINKLQNVGVTVVNDVKVEAVSESEGKKLLKFSDGSTALVDLVIKTGQTPNSGFLPPKFLDKKGFIVTTDHLTLEGYDNVMVLGDVVSCGQGNLVDLWHQQIPVIKTNVKALIHNDGKLGTYKAPRQFTLIPVGKSGGVGVFGSWNIPSWLVYFWKGKDYAIGAGPRFLS